MTNERSPIIRLGLDEIEVAPNAPGQWTGAGHAQLGDEMCGGGGVTRLLQRASQQRPGHPVVEAGSTTETRSNCAIVPTRSSNGGPQCDERS